MQGSHRSTGLLHSVMTSVGRRGLPWAGFAAACALLVLFSPVCLFSAERGGASPVGGAIVQAASQDEAQPVSGGQVEDRAFAIERTVFRVDEGVTHDGESGNVETDEPTPTPTPETEKPADQSQEVDAEQVVSEPPTQQVDTAPPALEPPAEPVETWQQAPVAPPVVPDAPQEPPVEADEPPAPSCPTASMSGFALALFNAINGARAQQGLPALASDGCVVHIAQTRAADMAVRNYFSHTSPDGETAFSLLDQNGVSYSWAAENLSTNNYPDDETVAIAIQTLMGSEAHRANILNGNFTHLGVGAGVDMAGTKYYAIVFTG